MIYSYAINVPANTQRINPVYYRLSLSEGIIHQVDVEFRSGTDFLVAVRILRGSYQVYPSNQDGEFRGDGRSISFAEHLPLISGDDELVVVAYSPGTTYDHVVYIKLGILQADELNMSQNTDNLITKFLRLVGIVK